MFTDKQVSFFSVRAPPGPCASTNTKHGALAMRMVVAAVGRGRGEPSQRIFEMYRRRLPWPLDLREVRAGRGGERGRDGEAAAPVPRRS